MADRFPSIEDFTEDSAPPTQNIPTSNGGDDDFLTRERALLGEDADQFASTDDRKATAAADDDDDDLLGGDFGSSSHAPAASSGGGGEGGGGGGLDDDFESSFPAIDAGNEKVAPGGTITGSNLPYHNTTSASEPRGESEHQRQWREKRDAQITERAKHSSEKKSERQSKARRDIDEFYSSRNSKLEKSQQKARKEEEEFLAQRVDTTSGEGTTVWSRAAQLVDLSGRGVGGGGAGSGKEKMRGLLVGLAKDEGAPGARVGGDAA